MLYHEKAVVKHVMTIVCNTKPHHRSKGHNPALIDRIELMDARFTIDWTINI